MFHRKPGDIYSTYLIFPRALESVLLSVLSALESEMTLLRELIGDLLAELEVDIDRDTFLDLLHRSRKLTSFQNRAKLVSTSCSTCPNPPKPKRSEPIDHPTLSLFTLQVHEALEEVLVQGMFHHGTRIITIWLIRYPVKTDEDLVAMYLTDKKNGIQREPSDHQDLEVLLESFAKQVEEIVNETETTQVCSATSHRVN